MYSAKQGLGRGAYILYNFFLLGFCVYFLFERRVRFMDFGGARKLCLYVCGHDLRIS
jgi:hypothetical protein